MANQRREMPVFFWRRKPGNCNIYFLKKVAMKLLNSIYNKAASGQIGQSISMETPRMDWSAQALSFDTLMDVAAGKHPTFDGVCSYGRN